MSPSPGPGGGLTACQALSELDRYRYSLDLRLFSPEPETPLDESQVGDPPFALVPNAPTFEFPVGYEGSVVSPDRTRVASTTEGQGAFETIYIGEQAWSLLQGQWILSTGREDVPFPPGRVCEAVMSGPDFEGVVPVEEELNGTATRHYRFDGVDSDTVGQLLGTQSDMGRLNKVYDVEVWLAPDGWPARLETSSEGTYPSGRKMFVELTLEVKDVNDKDIEVEPPT